MSSRHCEDKVGIKRLEERELNFIALFMVDMDELLDWARLLLL